MGGAIAKLVYSLKYRNTRAAAPDIARLLSDYMQSHPISADVIIPVPLHNRRERERGYNQSELLARELGGLTGLPVEKSALKRIRNTPPQVGMTNQEERQRNIEGAFACSLDMSERDILLIDDVVTTGSTMFACAKALKASNTGRVWGLALARQP
jgi:ComF family protein